MLSEGQTGLQKKVPETLDTASTVPGVTWVRGMRKVWGLPEGPLTQGEPSPHPESWAVGQTVPWL